MAIHALESRGELRFPRDFGVGYNPQTDPNDLAGIILGQMNVLRENRDRNGSVSGFFNDVQEQQDEFDGLNFRIHQLNLDVRAQVTDSPTMLQWTDFVLRWMTFYQDHRSGLVESIFPNMYEDEFNAFQDEFNDRLQAFKDAGLVTSTTPSTVPAPLTVADYWSYIKWTLILVTSAYLIGSAAPLITALIKKK